MKRGPPPNAGTPPPRGSSTPPSSGTPPPDGSSTPPSGGTPPPDGSATPPRRPAAPPKRSGLPPNEKGAAFSGGKAPFQAEKQPLEAKSGGWSGKTQSSQAGLNFDAIPPRPPPRPLAKRIWLPFHHSSAPRAVGLHPAVDSFAPHAHLTLRASLRSVCLARRHRARLAQSPSLTCPSSPPPQ
jgi:hypothetical protein